MMSPIVSDTPDAARHRDLTLDALRGIAILMILVLHGAVFTESIGAYPRLAEAVSRLGSGVQLFFVLSGYVITGAMDRVRCYRRGSIIFLARRASKIIPLYLIFLHINIIFYALWSHLSSHPTFFRNSVSAENLTWASYSYHLLFAQGIFPGSVNTLLDGDWSVLCEVYFYIGFALLFERTTRNIIGALWTLSGAMVISILFAVLAGRYLAERGSFGYYAFLAQAPCFFIGVLCYRIRDFVPVIESRPLQIAISTVLAIGFVGFIRLNTAPLGGQVVMSAIFAVAIIFLRFPPGERLFRLLRHLGGMSYALFYTHLILLKIVYSTLVANGIIKGGFLIATINMVIAVPGAWLLSWLLFDRIDRYFVALMSRTLSKYRREAS